MCLILTVLRKETLPASRGRGSQARVGVCEPQSQPNSQHSPSIPVSCCPLSCWEACPLTRKQNLHTSSSEVKADSAPDSQSLPVATIYENSVPPTNLKTWSRSLLGAALRDPWQPRLPPLSSSFSAPPSQLQDGQWDRYCMPGREGRRPGRTTACTEAAVGSCSSSTLGGVLAQTHAATGRETEARGDAQQTPREPRCPVLELPEEPQPL